MNPWLTDIFTLHIYTDGGCDPDGHGSWAFTIVWKELLICQRSGSVRNATSLGMEILAAEKALTFVPTFVPIHVHSDCKIMIDAMTQHHPRSQHPRYKNLRCLHAQRRVRWQWIKGHHRNRFNLLCDALCRSERRSDPTSSRY